MCGQRFRRGCTWPLFTLMSYIVKFYEFDVGQMDEIPEEDIKEMKPFNCVISGMTEKNSLSTDLARECLASFNFDLISYSNRASLGDLFATYRYRAQKSIRSLIGLGEKDGVGAFHSRASKNYKKAAGAVAEDPKSNYQ